MMGAFDDHAADGDEALPPGWEVVMSRSKNRPYYFHARLNKVYWVDDELPRGWSHQFDESGRRFYFHIRNKHETTTYDKPTRSRPARAEAELEAVAEASDDRGGGRDETHRRATPASNSLRDLLAPAEDDLDEQQQQQQQQQTSTWSAPTWTPTEGGGSGGGGGGGLAQLTREADPGAAAAFYNKLRRNATADRAESLLFHMRSMNNWVKSILINEYSKREDHVLDLACGKGGDLMKWAKRGILRYVGADIAQKSLEDAVDRFLSNVQHRDLEVQFVQGDLGRVSLLEDALHCWTRERGWHEAVPVATPAAFQIVSMQFSFHYMFGEEQRAHRFFRTLHEVLVDGGIFIATTVDPNKVLHKYYTNLGTATDDKGHHTTGGTDEDPDDDGGTRPRVPDIRIVDEQDREVCAIRFDEGTRGRLAGYDAPAAGAFGLRYNFTLRDTDDPSGGGGDTAVDLPEYLVPDDLLRRLLQEHGFELLLQQNFHPFILKNLERNRSLLDKMHVMNFEGTLSDAEWEIAGLYQVLAFKKAY